MAADIAEMLFREILGFTSYPGSPFTGNIFQDIILFFFVPTVFLIIFVYIVSGMVVPSIYGKLRLLMGLAIYAFIIASRYYEGFAIFASQFYFVFIILVGIIYFFSRHFRRAGGSGGMAYEGGHHGGGMNYEGTISKQYPDPSKLSDKELANKISHLEGIVAKTGGHAGNFNDLLEWYMSVQQERENKWKFNKEKFIPR